MNNLERLIISLGGVKVNRIKNTTTPSFLYRFENNLYITVEYDKRDQCKSVELGRLFLMKDFFPRLIVLEDFEVLLKAANSLRLPVNYKLKYYFIFFFREYCGISDKTPQKFRYQELRGFFP